MGNLLAGHYFGHIYCIGCSICMFKSCSYLASSDHLSPNASKTRASPPSINLDVLQLGFELWTLCFDSPRADPNHIAPPGCTLIGQWLIRPTSRKFRHLDHYLVTFRSHLEHSWALCFHANDELVILPSLITSFQFDLPRPPGGISTQQYHRGSLGLMRFCCLFKKNDTLQWCNVRILQWLAFNEQFTFHNFQAHNFAYLSN